MAAERAGLSILSAIGLRGLVAQNADDFVEIAKRLARDRADLAELRATLRSRMKSSPIMDAPASRVAWRALTGRCGGVGAPL